MPGKRVEDLTFVDPPDDRDTDWYKFLEEIDDLLATGHADWAEVTLMGIRTTVETYKRVSDGQRRAVSNVAAAVNGRRSEGGRRRYEGFHGRYR